MDNTRFRCKFKSGLAGQQAQFGQGLQAMQGTDIARLGQLGALNQAQEQAELDAKEKLQDKLHSNHKKK